MWNVKGYTLEMVVGDFGIDLPVTVTDTTLTASDTIRFTIKDATSGATILEKEYANISENTVQLSLTRAESELFNVGGYVYRLDWYQDGHFMCNIIPFADFKVVAKA